MCKSVGRWWNNDNIELVEVKGTVYALDGWNGESYCRCWKCTGERNMDAEGSFTLTPAYEEAGEEYRNETGESSDQS